MRQKKYRIRKRGLILILSIIITILLSFLLYLFFNPIFLKENNIKINIKDKFNVHDNIAFVFLGDKKDVKFEGFINTGKINSGIILYKYKNHVIELNYEVVDLKAPILTTKDVTVDMFEKVDVNSFVVDAYDDSEFDIHMDASNIDEIGDHKINIIAKDIANNTTTNTATLHRVEDIKAPEIIIDGDISFKQGQSFDYLSIVSVKDDFDKDVKVEVDASKVDRTKVGKYLVTYTSKDRSGNIATLEKEVVVLENPEYGNKVVYLTFDDGPSDNTAKVLDVLAKYDAKATFFVTGKAPSFNYNIKRAHEEGHKIALHTYTHNYAEVYSSIDAYFNDLNRISNMVYDITGTKSDLVRFPGGSSNTVSKKYTSGIMSKLSSLVKDKGYQYFDWNCSSGDAASGGATEAQIIKNATSSNAQYIIILMHDSQDKNTTVDALDDVIEHYIDAGYIFKSLSKDSFTVHHSINN